MINNLIDHFQQSLKLSDKGKIQFERGGNSEIYGHNFVKQKDYEIAMKRNKHVFFERNFKKLVQNFLKLLNNYYFINKSLFVPLWRNLANFFEF